MTTLDLKLSDEVARAIESGTPIVGLESNVISNGLPYPRNLELGFACNELLRSRGVTPAMAFVDRGKVHVGATDEDLRRLAEEPGVLKLTTRDLAAAIHSGRLGGTSVSASIRICAEVGLPIFASAGLGGVHRDFASTMDVSSDLYELTRHRIIVVSAGIKKFLDIPRTCELLETLNVPVLGFQTPVFPAFYCKDGGVRLSWYSEDWEELVEVSRLHVEGRHGGACLIVASPSDSIALDDILVEKAVQEALATATSQGITGKDITKFVMRSIDEATNRRTQQANFDVMLEIVSHAAEMSLVYYGGKR